MKEIGDEIDLNEGGKLLDYAKEEQTWDRHTIQWRIEKIAMTGGGELLRLCYWNKEGDGDWEWSNRPPAIEKDALINLLASAMKKGII